MKTSHQKNTTTEQHNILNKRDTSSTSLSDNARILQRIFTGNGQIKPRQILQLQRILGNKKVQGLLNAAHNGSVFVQRADEATEEVKLKVKYVGDDNITVELGEINPDSIVSLTLFYEQIPRANGETEDRGVWYFVGGSRLYINKRVRSAPKDVDVRVTVISSKKNAPASSGGSGGTGDAASGTSANGTTSDSSGNKQGQASDSSPASGATNASGSTSSNKAQDDDSEPKTKEGTIDEIIAECEEKGLHGSLLSKRRLEVMNLSQTQLDTILYRVMELKLPDKAKASDKDIDHIIEDVRDNGV